MHRTIKSYVLRAGRISNRQNQGLEEWLPHYELRLGASFWCLPEVFGQNNDTIVEIGFGMGRSLVSMALSNPEFNYIGIEVHKAGIGSLAADLHDLNLNNVRIVAEDAVRVFETQIEDNSLAGVQIFFPDPWHKKRHHKRRLIQPPFIDLVVKKIRPGGFIHCATDWEDYAEHIRLVLSANPSLKNLSATKDYISSNSVPAQTSNKNFIATSPHSPCGHLLLRPGEKVKGKKFLEKHKRPKTKFEERGERLGHLISDLVFIKQDIEQQVLA